MYDEGTVCYNRGSRLIDHVNYGKGALGRGTYLVALDEGTGATCAKNIDVDYRESSSRVGHSFQSLQESVRIGKVGG
jgi:hypothetical protein